MPEKQTGIDFLSPRVFPHDWEGRGVFHAAEVNVCAFNYFPVAEVLFPIITRAFSDVESITHSHKITYAHTQMLVYK